jgi:hypothetical protein
MRQFKMVAVPIFQRKGQHQLHKFQFVIPAGFKRESIDFTGFLLSQE